VASFEVHPHLQTRLELRGISVAEVEEVLRVGWPGGKPRPGNSAVVHVFGYEAEWNGRWFAEKEVTVYFKETDEGRMVLTAMARYGDGFPRGGAS
jgi:hypothetical protein